MASPVLFRGLALRATAPHCPAQAAFPPSRPVRVRFPTAAPTASLLTFRPKERQARPKSSAKCSDREAPVPDGAAKDAKKTDPLAECWPWGDYVPEFDQEDFCAVQRRFSRESKEAVAALRGMILSFFRSLLDNFNHLLSLKTVYDTEDYHIGMPFGALIACVGCYQLWKLNRTIFLDAVLGYAFYKLSVVSSQLRRQGFSNDLITRVKFVIMVIMAINDHKDELWLLDAIRAPVYLMYFLSFAYEVIGIKKQIKYLMAFIMLKLMHPEKLARSVRGDMLPDEGYVLVSESGIRL